MEHLGAKLREIRKRKGWSVAHLEQEWGVPKDRIYKWEQGTKPTDPKDYIGLLAFIKSEKLEDFTRSNPEKRLAVAGDLRQGTEREKAEHSLANAKEGVPVYDVEFSAGAVASFMETRGDVPVIARLLIPEVSGCDAIIRARGDSMDDFIRAGDWIGIKQINDLELILWDYPYAITTDELELIKYLKKGSSSKEVILSSHNKRYSDVVLLRHKIRQLFIVKVVLPFSLIKTII